MAMSDREIWEGPEGRKLVVKTESGSRYEFEGRLMRKFDKDETLVDSFKAYVIKTVPSDVKNTSEIYQISESYPEVGNLLYVSGYEAWWLSTPVVSVQEVDVERKKRQNEN